MRHLLILACLLFGTGAMADEGDFDFKSLGAKKALRDYKATHAKEDKAKRKAIEEMEAEAKKAQKTNRVELIMNLEQALKKALQDADLEEANKIDAAIKALKKGAGPAGGLKDKEKSLSKKARTPLVVGVWKTTAPPGNKNIFIVRPNKTAHHSGDVMEGRWEAANRSGRDFIIHWSNGVVDNIKINRSDKIFDGFTPSSGYRWQMTRDPYPRR